MRFWHRARYYYKFARPRKSSNSDSVTRSAEQMAIGFGACPATWIMASLSLSLASSLPLRGLELASARSSFRAVASACAHLSTCKWNDIERLPAQLLTRLWTMPWTDLYTLTLLCPPLPTQILLHIRAPCISSAWKNLTTKNWRSELLAFRIGSLRSSLRPR